MVHNQNECERCTAMDEIELNLNTEMFHDVDDWHETETDGELLELLEAYDC